MKVRMEDNVASVQEKWYGKWITNNEGGNTLKVVHTFGIKLAIQSRIKY